MRGGTHVACQTTTSISHYKFCLPPSVFAIRSKEQNEHGSPNAWDLTQIASVHSKRMSKASGNSTASKARYQMPSVSSCVKAYGSAVDPAVKSTLMVVCSKMPYVLSY